MKHNLKISVSNKPAQEGIVSCRTVSLRKRLIRKLFGDRQKVTIIVPGDSVNEITILETASIGGVVDAT